MSPAPFVIAAVGLAHGLLGAFSLGALLIGVLAETLGLALRRPAYDQLAFRVAGPLARLFAAAVLLGALLLGLLELFRPEFWRLLDERLFWPFLIQLFLLLGAAVFVARWSSTWTRSVTLAQKRRHPRWGWLAAGLAVAGMFVMNLPAVSLLTRTPLDPAWAGMTDSAWVYLDIHRLFGSVVLGGFGLAGLCALGLARAGPPEARAHFRWASGYCVAVGFGALLVMPVAGYHYLLSLRFAHPHVFYTLMLGERSSVFVLVAFFYGMLLVVGSLYIAPRVKAGPLGSGSSASLLPISLVVLILAAVVLTLPYYIQHLPFAAFLTEQRINPLGKMQPQKYVAIALLVTFGLCNWIYFLRTFPGSRGRRAPGPARQDRWTVLVLVLLAGLALAMHLVMGWVAGTALISSSAADHRSIPAVLLLRP